VEGVTPLESGTAVEGPQTALSFAERFPYYRSFPFAWYFACYSEDLPAGGVRALRYLARDLVVWRDEEGTPHVIDAYCPHLGAHLGYGGRVEGCELVCPYHWWRYDGDGNNCGIPYSTRVNKRAKVKTYPTIDRNGMVMFWYHPTGEPPHWEIPEVPEFRDAAFEPYVKGKWRIRTSWQEMAENGPDYIHLRTVHGAEEVPELESWETDGHVVRLRSRQVFRTPKGPTEGRIDVDSIGPGFAVARFSGIVDTTMVAAAVPIDFELLDSHKAYLVRRSDGDNGAASRVGAALVADLQKQMREDMVIWENKIFHERPALADTDGPVMTFRTWAAQFYVDGDPVTEAALRRAGVPSPA
jgi:nitrite reductase/ring-hydroxylating ferredoxin subunit